MNVVPCEAGLPAGSLDGARSMHMLADALRDEGRLLGQLGEVLREQRSAVACDDLARVEETVYGAQRVLVNVAEARRRRQSLVRMVSGAGDTGVGELPEVLGSSMTDDLRDACSHLTRVARGLSAELVVNRRVLEGAVCAGDQMIRILGGQPTRAACYGPDAANSGSAGGSLINRQI